MRPVILTKSLAAASATNIALVQPLAAAGNLLINGAAATGGVATLDTQRRVLITSSGDDRLINFTVTGTMESGAPISETLAGSNGTTVATAQDFFKITQVSASGAVAGTVSVGTNGVGSTAWQVPNAHITPFELTMDVEIVSGAVNVTIEVSNDSPLPDMQIYRQGYSTTQPVPVPFGYSGLTAIAVNSSGTIGPGPVACWRLTVNSGTGVAKAVGIQSGIRN